MNFKLNSKQSIYLSFGIVVLLVIFIVFFTLTQASKIESEISRISQNNSKKSLLISEMVFHATHRSSLIQRITHTADFFKRDKLYIQLREHGGHFLKDRELLLQLSLDDKEKSLLQKQRQLSAITGSEQNKAAQLLIEGKDQQAKRLILNIATNQSRIIQTLNDINRHLNEKNKNTHKNSIKQLNKTIGITLILTVFVITILSITAWLVYRNISNHIKKLKLFYKKVKNSEIRERKIRNLMIDSVIVIDHKGIIKEFNKAAEDIFGYSENEINGKNVDLLMSSADKNQHDQYIDNYLQTGRSQIIGVGREVIAKRKDGTIFFADLSISNLYNDKNGKPFFLGTLHDISIRKENELQLIQTQNDLEQRVKQRTKELATANELLSQQANFDALTGLANRYLFFDRLKQIMAQAKRHDYSLAILFIDLDGFKNINDLCGHDVGDEVLKKIAQRMQQCLRAEDIVARLGGDEFLVVLNEINDVSHISQVVEKIISVINQPLNLTKKNIPVGASIGISIYPKDNVDPDELLKQADIAMYQSKNKGKNTYTFFGGATS